MIGGLNQEVEILGRTYHVQTELSDTGIRTEVFLGGKLVASREKPVAAADLDGSSLLTLIQEQHEKILAGVAERLEKYRKRGKGRTGEPAAGEPAAVAPAAVAPAAGEPAASVPGKGVPSRVPAETVDLGLRLRRLLEEFRLRLGRLPQEPRGSAQLERAAEHFRWILQSSSFPELRIDEQVRFNMLHDRLQAWLQGERDPDRGRQLWSNIRTFNGYLAEINNRAELAAFDRDLLAWTLHRMETDGMSERLREHLSLLTGRDRELDRLLAEPQGVGDEAWAAELHRVLVELEEG